MYVFAFIIAGANPYLTFHCASQGTVLIDLASDDKEFQSVEEEVSGEMMCYWIQEKFLETALQHEWAEHKIIKYY